MKKIYFFVCCFLFFTVHSFSQYSKYIVQLKDKKGTPHSLSSPATYLSSKAVDRRARYKINIDSTDLPVSPAYIDSIRSIPNVSIHNISKWLNQVCITTTDAAALIKINSFPFVKKTDAIAAIPHPADPGILSKKFSDLNPVPAGPVPIVSSIKGTQQDFYEYGNNAGQVKIHEGEYLHNKGFHGEGMTIAVLDGGFFNFKTNIALDSIRFNNQILGEWDFVKNEASTNEDNAHGFWCLSVIAANRPGLIVGTAPKAKFWLFRTEDVATEYPVEEQNWVVAAEFADSAGVDMITSSLGYSDFTDPVFDHSYAERNGNTTLVTIGADLAAKKGILVTNSAGNSGRSTNDLKYIICPADGDSVLCVGATDVNGAIASFSSWGPNGAGKTKPNVVSVGANAVVASSVTGNPALLNGTSFSNPNMCGLAACLWQAFPEFNNMEIIDALQRSSNKYTAPDDRFGYGIPNMRKAYDILAAQKLLRDMEKALGNKWIKAFPVPFKSELGILLKAPLTGRADIRLVDMAGRTLELKTLDITQDNFYTLSFSSAKTISSGAYTIQYADGKNKTSIQVLK